MNLSLSCKTSGPTPAIHFFQWGPHPLQVPHPLETELQTGDRVFEPVGDYLPSKYKSRNWAVADRAHLVCDAQGQIPWPHKQEKPFSGFACERLLLFCMSYICRVIRCLKCSTKWFCGMMDECSHQGIYSSTRKPFCFIILPKENFVLWRDMWFT